MRFLHTSDWHIGKKLEGRDRLEEQRAVLEEIVAIAEREEVDVVLVAGDVFDTYLPSSDAEDLFYEMAMKLADRKRLVVIISGNHDDATRLCAAVPLAEKLGIVLVGNANEPICSHIVTERARVCSAGAGWLVCEKNEERVFLSLVPYPTESRYKEEASEGETFSDKMTRWLNAGALNNTENLPMILVGHFFAVGGVVSDSEREIDLGGVRAVSKEMMPKCAYVALGHLHKKQVMSWTKNVRYSGSILSYAFDEAGSEKSVSVFDLKNGNVIDLKEIPLTFGKQLYRLYAESPEDAERQLSEIENGYVELNLKMDRPLEYAESKRLRSAFPNLIKLNLELIEEQKQKASSRKSLNDREMFTEYYRSKFGKLPEEQLLALYMELMEEVDQ